MHFRRFFQTWLSMYIINIAGRISEAAMGKEGGAQQSILPVNEPKKTGAQSARAGTDDQNLLVANLL
jgi:hypothetical protein